MAYYDALKAAWNNPTQPPPGVTGIGLAAGMSTDVKIGHVNNWTMSGAIPTSFYTNGAEVLNAIIWPEFKVLTQAQQNTVLNMLAVQGQLLSGTDNVTRMVPGMILEYFPGGTTTRANLIALAKGVTAPWWQVEVAKGGGGLSGPVSLADTQAAGLV